MSKLNTAFNIVLAILLIILIGMLMVQRAEVIMIQTQLDILGLQQMALPFDDTVYEHQYICLAATQDKLKCIIYIDAWVVDIYGGEAVEEEV